MLFDSIPVSYITFMQDQSKENSYLNENHNNIIFDNIL